MIRVTGPIALVPNASAPTMDATVNDKLPEVAVDYACTRVENITYDGDTCACDIESASEAAIIADEKYTV